MRTTVDIDPVVLTEVRERQAAEGKSLGAVVSELLATGLAASRRDAAVEFSWTTGSLQPRVDLEDKDALADLLDQP